MKSRIILTLVAISALSTASFVGFTKPKSKGNNQEKTTTVGAPIGGFTSEDKLL